MFQHNDILVSQEQMAADQQRFMVKVYAWMSAALLVTGLVAMWTATTPEALAFIFGNKMVFYGLLILELAFVGSLVGLVNRLSAAIATLIFLAYSIVNGLTLSVVFIAYTQESVATTFFITAGTFAAMSAYGYFTKSDLTKMGNILFMALIGLIIASIVNLFFYSEILYWITSYAGVLIFTGLIAYDTQKLKAIGLSANQDFETGRKQAIIGALSLYLDFINLFLMLLRFFGRKR